MNKDQPTPLRETVEADEAVALRLSALLNLIPGWGRNETATVDAAKGMVRWARRLGWMITIEEEGRS